MTVIVVCDMSFGLCSQLQCPWIVQFMGCRLDPISKQCALITEYMPRRCLHSVLHVDKLELNWNQRVNIVSFTSTLLSGQCFLCAWAVLCSEVLSLVPNAPPLSGH